MPLQTGYRIRIDAFIPADPADIDRLGIVAAAIKRARDEGEPSAVLALGAIEEITIKSQTRRMAAPMNTAQADQDDRVRAEGKPESAPAAKAEKKAKAPTEGPTEAAA